MIRIARREDLPKWQVLLIRIISVLFGLVLSALIIIPLGYNPVTTFTALFIGAFGSGNALITTIKIAIPLCITALGLSIAFRMKYWNIGGEGQILMGCIFATYVSHQMPPDTNGLTLMLLMGLAGFAGGAIWALIPGIFRVYFRTNETLFTLMMNYIALFIVQYLHFVLWLDPAAYGFPGIKSIPAQAHLPKVFGIHIGWIIAIILAVLLFLLIRKTKLGYEIRVVGESEPTANYAGMNVKKVMLTGIILSGGIVGLAGMIKLSGDVFTLSPDITGNAGFTAIVIAWLSSLSAPVIVFVSVLIAALEQGSQIIQIKTGGSAAVTGIIQGLILMSALGFEFFLRYKIIKKNTVPDMAHVNSAEADSASLQAPDDSSVKGGT
jgi:ABC-type uncharacterized transport system permease subunit